MFIRIIGLCFFLALSGCQILGDNDEGRLLLETNLVLETNETDFRVGNDLRLTLTNGSSNSYTIHPDLCGARLQVWKNEGWRTIEEDGFCTLIGLDLNPGQRAQTTRTIDTGLEAGRYRYEYSIYVLDGDELVVQSQEFEIKR